MTQLTLTPEARTLINILHRGGPFGYLWGVQGDEKITRWFRSGQPAQPLNSRHNNYVGVHPTTARGTSSQLAKKGERDIAAINCLFAEFDDKDFSGARGSARAYAATIEPRPSVTVDSGGGVQCYWLFHTPFVLASDAERARADRAQKSFVKWVKSDDGAKDLARVLRVPGTFNYKYDPPRPVTIIEAEYHRLYTLDELEAILPPEPAPKERASRQKAADPARSAGSTSDHDFDTIADAARNLGRLAAWRRDAYSTWIDVGMALRELGSIGYELWEKWSKLSSKYQPGDCETHWATFKAGAECGGITLASLARWAHEDAPEPVAPAVPEQLQLQLQEYREEEAKRLKILRNPVLEDREKVAWLSMRNTLGARMALRPDGSVRLSGEDVGRVMGRSESTGNRAIRTLEKHGVLICDPVPVTTPDGREVMQMRVQPGPAFDAPEQIAPIEDKAKRGGEREGAGRKPNCARCSPETAVIARTVKKVEYQCLGCGDILKTETTPISAEVLTAEINIDFEETVAAAGDGEGPAPVAVAAPEFNFDFGDVASDQPEDNTPPEIKVDCSVNHGYLGSRPASAPTDNRHSQQSEVAIIGPTRIGDAIVNLGYIQNRLKAGDLSAIETHCRLAGADYGAVIAAAQAPPAGGSS